MRYVLQSPSDIYLIYKNPALVINSNVSVTNVTRVTWNHV